MPKFKISTQAINSYGFIVLTSGIDLTEFLANPVMLHNHNPNELIGKWVNLEKDGTDLVGEPEFDMALDLAKEKAGQVDRGYLKGVSMGIDDIEMQFGIAGFEDVPVVTSCRLYEISLTPIPSNADALRLYKKGKLLSKEEITGLLSRNNNQKPNIQMKNLAMFAALLSITKAEPSEEDVLRAVQEKINSNQTLTNEKATLATEIANLQATITTLKAKLKEADDAKADALVDAAHLAKKINDKQVAKFKELARQNYDGTKEILDGMVPHVPISGQLNRDTEGSEDGKDYKDWTFAKLTKEAPDELARIRKDEPERYNKLFQAYVKR